MELSSYLQFQEDRGLGKSENHHIHQHMKISE